MEYPPPPVIQDATYTKHVSTICINKVNILWEWGIVSRVGGGGGNVAGVKPENLAF